MNTRHLYKPRHVSELKDANNSNESQLSHLIYFDIRFRMSANIHADSLESALDKIHDYSERELLNFDERDAPEITICNVF